MIYKTISNSFLSKQYKVNTYLKFKLIKQEKKGKVFRLFIILINFL